MADLNLPVITSGQSQKFQTSNDADAALDNAITESLDNDYTSGNVTLTNAEFRENFRFNATNLSVARVLTVQAIKRYFLVDNTGGSNTLTVTLGSTTEVLQASTVGLFYTDGTANGLIILSLAAALGSAASENIGTSGDNVPKLNAANTWSAIQLNSATPRFLVQPSSDQDNAIGTAATGLVEVDWGTEHFDIGGNFASNVFTAPVTGPYLLTCAVRLEGITAVADALRLDLKTTKRTYTHLEQRPNNMGQIENPSFSIVVDMDANDTASVEVRVTGEATDVVDIKSSSYFSGTLLP